MAEFLSAAFCNLIWRMEDESEVRESSGRSKPLAFTQDDLSLRITRLPAIAPDQPATVIAIECDGEPEMSHEYVRRTRPRFTVGAS